MTAKQLVGNLAPDGSQYVTLTDGAGTLVTETGGVQSSNMQQVAGTTTDTNSGNKSAGTLRVVIATDQPQLTNKLLVTPDANSAINLAQIAGNTVSTGVGASGTGVQRVILSKVATGTQSNVASSASSVTVLASNANRQGATVYNDSTQILYLLLVTGGTASNSVYTAQLAPNAYYEVPFNYTGDLKGIWASANGNARVTEFT